MPTNLLNLPAYTVTRVDETDHDYHVYVTVTDAPSVCRQCGSTAIVGGGRREQLVRDLPSHGKRVGIYVDTRRFRCRACSKTFSEPLPHTDERRAINPPSAATHTRHPLTTAQAGLWPRLSSVPNAALGPSRLPQGSIATDPDHTEGTPAPRMPGM